MRLLSPHLPLDGKDVAFGETYFKNKFLKLFKDKNKARAMDTGDHSWKRRQMYVFATCNIDTSKSKAVFASVKSSLLTRAVEGPIRCAI